LFILKLAFDAFRAFRRMDPDRQPDVDAGPASLLNAVVINFLNPNPWIFWGSVGARELVEGWRRTPSAGLGFMIGFYIMLIGTFVGFVLLFGTARRLGPRVTYWLTGLSALALGSFGAYELIVGVGALLGA
jgi:threonine/homoserine/homoserine lactone efflux protein